MYLLPEPEIFAAGLPADALGVYCYLRHNGDPAPGVRRLVSSVPLLSAQLQIPPRRMRSILDRLRALGAVLVERVGSRMSAFCVGFGAAADAPTTKQIDTIARQARRLRLEEPPNPASKIEASDTIKRLSAEIKQRAAEIKQAEPEPAPKLELPKSAAPVRELTNAPAENEAPEPEPDPETKAARLADMDRALADMGNKDAKIRTMQRAGQITTEAQERKASACLQFNTITGSWTTFDPLPTSQPRRTPPKANGTL